MCAAQLLAVVEVPHDDRVRCQATGCNHPVFRRIHVVRDEAGIHVYGSECFKKLFLGLPVASSTPAYTSAEGRALTDEERKLLIENTGHLIQQFEADYQAEIEEKVALAKGAARPTPNSQSVLPPRPVQPAITPEVRLAAETRAKAIVRSKYDIDPELPGWRGLVLSEMERILGKDVGKPQDQDP